MFIGGTYVCYYSLQMISCKQIDAACQILSVLRKPLDQVAIAENSYERKATFASLTKELQDPDKFCGGAQRQRAPAPELASVENVATGNLTDTTNNEKLPGLMKSEGWFSAI